MPFVPRRAGLFTLALVTGVATNVATAWILVVRDWARAGAPPSAASMAGDQNAIALGDVLSVQCIVNSDSRVRWWLVQQVPANQAMPGPPQPGISLLLPPTANREQHALAIDLALAPLPDWIEERMPTTGALHAMAFDSGWPWRALSAHHLLEVFYFQPGMASRTLVERSLPTPDTHLVPAWARNGPLPVVPIWRGFVANSLVYAAVWLIALLGYRSVRNRRRRLRSLCQRCGYPLTGLADASTESTRQGACPECGSERTASVR